MQVRKRTWVIGVNEVKELFGESQMPRILTFDEDILTKMRDEWLDPERETREANAIDLICAMRVSWLAMEEYEDLIHYNDPYGARVVICDSPEYNKVLMATAIYDDPIAETMLFVGR